MYIVFFVENVDFVYRRFATVEFQRKPLAFLFSVSSLKFH